MDQKNNFGGRAVIALVFLFLYAPILLLIVFSFNAGDSSAVWRGFSLRWYESLFQNRLIIESVYMTLLVSLLATLIATVAGTFAAIGLYSLPKRRRDFLLTVNNIPMMNADIVTGVSLCLFFVAFFQLWRNFAVWMNGHSGTDLPERLTLGFSTLLIAHIVFNIPYVILNVAPKLRQMDRNLVDAAMDLGCTWMQAFWKVILPEIRPGIVSGALIAFTMSIDDFVISYFTAGSSTSTLAMAIYGMTKRRVTPEINAVSTLLFAAVLLLLVASNIRDAAQSRRNARNARNPERSQNRAPARRTAGTILREKSMAFFSTRQGRMVRWGAGAVLAVCFILAVRFLAHETSSRPVVNVCSWGEYIDTDLIDRFEEETGIRVNYQTAESNETMYSLLKSGGGDYDVIVPSDYMIARLIAEDMLQPLRYENIPNFALIGDDFKNLSYDPENLYTVPYLWGTLGIIYNETMVDGEIDSWGDLYSDENAGRVLLINNSRDALAEALLYLGYSINTTDEGEIREAYNVVANAVARGVFQGKVMDEVFQTMEGGNAAIATYYAGDYLSMLDNNEDLRYVIPKEGGNWFVDAMCVLKDARHPDEAEAWINFIASTDCNLANMDYVGYASPNAEALEQYPAYYEEQYGEELDPELFEIMAAPPEVLDRCEMYVNLPPETLNLYNNLWIRLGI